MASTTNVVVEKARTDKVVTGGAPATPPRVATHKKAIILIVVLVLVGSLLPLTFVSRHSRDKR